MSIGCLGTEIQVYRAIFVVFELVIGRQRGIVGIGLNLGTGLEVVQSDGPEQIRRWIGRDVETVQVAAIEPFAR